MSKLFLLDAYALIYRAYYAFIRAPRINSKGQNTSAIFGFVNTLEDVLKKEQPTHIGVAFDPKGGTFRHEMYEQYKAQREETPEDIRASVPIIKDILRAYRIPILEVPGYEADDVIGTLAHQADLQGIKTYMMTPDKDYGQLVTENSLIYRPKFGDKEFEVMGIERVKEKFGIERPEQVIDLLGLMGDSSDNIPGCPGVGEKTAQKLIAEFGDIPTLLARRDELKGALKKKVDENVGLIELSRFLATIKTDAPITLDLEVLKREEPDEGQIQALFEELEFRTLLKRVIGKEAETSSNLPSKGKTQATRKSTADALQGDLFAPAQGDLFGMFSEEGGQDLFHTNLSKLGDIPHVYTLVDTVEMRGKLVEKLTQADAFAFDTETTGFDIYSDRIVGLSLAIEPHEAWYISFTPENAQQFADIVRPLFEAESITKVAQNMKFDIMVLARLGIEVKGRKIDTMILHYLIDAESRHNMNYLAERYLHYSPIAIETLIGRGARQLTMDQVNIMSVKEYAAEDADITLQLKHLLWAEIEKQGLKELYERIEEPMIEVLADMEMQGVRIDPKQLADYAVELNNELQHLESEIRSEADEPTLNVNSARQLGEVLFAKMRITDKPKMTKTRQFSTEEEYLQGFAGKHRIVDMILQYRGVKKLLSTYVEALPLLINPATGRIHTSFNQAVTATGRLSSTNPNLQNIPVRDQMGRRIREAFIPRDENHLLLSADYSQVELRLMAHLSGDPSLIEAFRQGEDIHSATAAKLFHKTSEEVTSEERRRAKTANFGIIYGISAFGLSQRLDIPRKEAKEIIEGYFASYPKVKEYMDSAITDAREKGYVETVFGRRRYLRDIASRNAVARGVAERNAINAPIQGSAADIMKIAMIEIYRRFQQEGIRSKMILQVHDEVIVDMLKEEQERVVAIVKEAMESAAQLSVPLISDAGIGTNWLEAH